MTIGKGVTSIGSSAFEDTAYYKDDTNWNQDGVLYNNHCLLGAKDTLSGAYTIGEEVLAIAVDAFSICSNLESLSVADDHPNYSSQDGILYNKEKTKIIAVPKGIKGAVTIPAGVAELSSVFTGCIGLESMTVEANNPNYSSQDGILYNKAQTELVYVPKSIKGTVTISDGVTEIGERMFYSCNGLVGIEIPDSVTSIKEGAFYNCTSLKGVYITDLVAWCGINFSRDYNGRPANPLYYAHHLYLDGVELKQLVIPAEVTKIEDYAFYNCSGLTGELRISSGVTSIGSYAFHNCNGITSITISDSVAEIEHDAFDGCSGLTRVNITDLAAWCKIRFLHMSANPLGETVRLYLDEEEVKELKIPSGVTSIGSYAFCGCRWMTSIEIPDSVTSIGEDAFMWCSGLTSVTIPDSVTVIGHGAFCSCDGLESVTIGGGVTEIGEYAFQGCSGLTSVTIGSDVTKIGDRAFANCRGLTDIQFRGTVEEWQAIDKVENGSYYDWDYGIYNYTVTCTNGTVKKDGTVTYFNN